MNTKHTPAPWYVNPTNENAYKILKDRYESGETLTHLEKAALVSGRDASEELAALTTERDALKEALARIFANPAVQDLIEAEPRTNYLIRDARALLAKLETK